MSSTRRDILKTMAAAGAAMALGAKGRTAGNPDGWFNRTEGKNEKIPNGTFYEMKRLYYECAHAAYPMPMAAVRARPRQRREVVAEI